VPGSLRRAAEMTVGRDSGAQFAMGGVIPPPSSSGSRMGPVLGPLIRFGPGQARAADRERPGHRTRAPLSSAELRIPGLSDLLLAVYL
jgi:hypothetical protein